ncbi:hypothetical protein V1291_005552 [Nitrobacteraceae bacterium AZCC 1564]
MFTIQLRRERMNRQINERLLTLIAAYKTFGGSFIGNLTVNSTQTGGKGGGMGMEMGGGMGGCFGSGIDLDDPSPSNHRS